MPILYYPPQDARRVIARRRALGHDHHDEVWNGVYVMSPIPNDEHQDLVGGLVSIFQVVIGWLGLGKVRPGVNISDRRKSWKRNFRVPDVTVFLQGCKAICRGAFWFGGPDFAAEIISKGDRSRKKLDFYAKVGTCELLLVDRYPWALELYSLQEGKLELAGRSTLQEPQLLESKVLPLVFRLVAGEERPKIEVTHPQTGQRWLA
jgi:Uma2 family endonuclease